VIFVDTSFWVGLRNRRDPNHEQAASMLRQPAGESLLTSNHMRAETWTFLRRRAGHRAAVDFLDHLGRSTRVPVHHVSSEIETRALRWLRKHDEREYSFVDAASFALMSSKRIREALAFDGEFSAAGFIGLRS